MVISQADLVEHFIKAYLKFQEPIGSETLRLCLDVKVSSATIRSHFKELVAAGVLRQLHPSSGRIPSESALRQYWKARLNPLARPTFSNLATIKEESKRAGIFCGIRFYCPNLLEEVVAIQQRFLILRFSKGEVVLNYSDELERFLDSIMGLDANDILILAHKLAIPQLALKIRSLETESMSFYGVNTLATLIKEVDDEILFENISKGAVLESHQEGLYFDGFTPKGSLAFIQNAKLYDKSIRFICVGAINKDYEEFYKKILA